MYTLRVSTLDFQLLVLLVNTQMLRALTRQCSGPVQCGCMPRDEDVQTRDDERQQLIFWRYKMLAKPRTSWK